MPNGYYEPCTLGFRIPCAAKKYVLKERVCQHMHSNTWMKYTSFISIIERLFRDSEDVDKPVLLPYVVRVRNKECWKKRFKLTDTSSNSWTNLVCWGPVVWRTTTKTTAGDPLVKNLIGIKRGLRLEEDNWLNRYLPSIDWIPSETINVFGFLIRCSSEGLIWCIFSKHCN